MKLRTTDYEPLEPGDYRAKFTGYEEDEGEHGPFVKLFFELLDEEHAGKILTGIAYTKFNPMSKLFAWTQALLGRPIEDGEEIDLDDLVGRECMLDIEHRKTERGTFERVVAVRPVRKKKGKPEPVADEEDFDDLHF